MWVASGVFGALTGCGPCGSSSIGAGPPQSQAYEKTTDSGEETSGLSLLDLQGSESTWRAGVLELWSPSEVVMECAPLDLVPMLTLEAIEPRIGGEGAVQCVARARERTAGKPVSARVIMVDGKLASASLIFSVSDFEDCLSAFRGAMGQPAHVRLEDRTDLLPSTVEAYLRLENSEASALLVGQVTIEFIHQDLRVLSSLKKPRDKDPPSIDALGIGLFKATDTVDLSTAE